MKYWISLCLLVAANALELEYEDIDECASLNCVGDEYVCLGGECACASGYIPDSLQASCVRCPTYGQQCNTTCCERGGGGGGGGSGSRRVVCWQGYCRRCYDNHGNWICQTTIDQTFLVSITQIAMATALVLGIVATFVLLYKLCAATTTRSRSTYNEPSRLSVGSLQLWVDERLRDAPPRYTRATLPDPAQVPASVFVNAGFIHDSSIPPPPYSAEDKPEEDTNNNNTNNNNTNNIISTNNNLNNSLHI